MSGLVNNVRNTMKTKKIQLKDLKVGDKIKTCIGDEICFEEVTDVWDTVVNTNEQVYLHFTNGAELECSVNHPIMALGDNGFIEILPENLTKEIPIVTDSGLTYLKEIIVGRDNDENYIDITVSNLHTFFASDRIDGEMILTHNSQGGVRGGAATMNYPIWHLEAEKLLVLKNNKGVEENRIRHMDYSVAINRLMFKRLVNDDYITLFSPNVECGLLYESYYSDPELFERIYTRLESSNVPKKRIKATELFSILGQERNGTGRIYPFFVDNVNQHGPYLESIRQSNLCMEIALPTYPLSTPDEEVALCTLAAYNLGAIDSMEELEELSEVAIRALDNLLDYQDYPVEAALKAKKRRALGIGVTNFAYFLAKNFVKYSDGSANRLVHKWMEAISYYNIKASCKLAKERGVNEWHHKTRWSKGELPIDWYNKNVDKLIKPVYFQDWESLRADVKRYGVRNDTTSAFMPCESSSQISNSTNGIEPPRSLVSTKQSKDGVFNQVVPEIETLAVEYETAWQMAKHGNIGYLTLVAIMQKFVDQSISANQYYDPSNNESGKIHMEDILRELAFCSHFGLKSLYYSNTRDGADGTEDEGCEGCKV